jgi:hypothetical protein
MCKYFGRRTIHKTPSYFNGLWIPEIGGEISYCIYKTK